MKFIPMYSTDLWMIQEEPTKIIISENKVLEISEIIKFFFILTTWLLV